MKSSRILNKFALFMEQNCPFKCNLIMYIQNVGKNNDLTKIQGHMLNFPY